MKGKIFLILLFLFSTAFSISADVGKTIDPSYPLYTAHTRGIGGAGLTHLDNGEGVFINPANIADIDYPKVTLLSRKISFDEANYLLANISIPTDRGNFGFGFVDTNISGSMPTQRNSTTGRIEINPSLEAYGQGSSAIYLTYARKLPFEGDWNFGINLKFFNSQVKGGGEFYKAQGYDFDLGLQKKIEKWLMVGANIQNVLGGRIKWDTPNEVEEEIGRKIKIGFGINVLDPKEGLRTLDEHKVRAYIDFDFPSNQLSQNNSLIYHAGVEWFPLKYLSLRGGINQENGGSELAFGVGLKQNAFRFDYAYALIPGMLGNSPHYFSFSYVGDVIADVYKKIKRKEVAIEFLEPKDRSITSEESIVVKAKTEARHIMDQKTVWTVPFLSSTSEVKEVYETEPLHNVFLNGKEYGKISTVEAKVYLSYGRNVIKASGTILEPETLVATRDVKVLRFKPFIDTPMTYWAIEPIALISTLKIIKGYPDGEFKPERGITRAELVTLLVRTTYPSPDIRKELASGKKFKDIKPTHWAAQYISVGSYMGLIKGYPDGTFKPSRVLTRAEGVTILARFSKLTIPQSGFEIPFPDLQSEYWANKYIAAADKAGLLKYLKNKDFEPKREMPRSEATEVLYRTPQVKRWVNNFWEYGLEKK